MKYTIILDEHHNPVLQKVMLPLKPTITLAYGETSEQALTNAKALLKKQVSDIQELQTKLEELEK